jgi:hypothetical protein
MNEIWFTECDYCGKMEEYKLDEFGEPIPPLNCKICQHPTKLHRGKMFKHPDDKQWREFK